jgi:hypothetical protein
MPAPQRASAYPALHTERPEFRGAFFRLTKLQQIGDKALPASNACPHSSPTLTPMIFKRPLQSRLYSRGIRIFGSIRLTAMPP